MEYNLLERLTLGLAPELAPMLVGVPPGDETAYDVARVGMCNTVLGEIARRGVGKEAVLQAAAEAGGEDGGKLRALVEACVGMKLDVRVVSESNSVGGWDKGCALDAGGLEMG